MPAEDDPNPNHNFSDRYRHRIVQALELCVFVAFGMLFYAWGPFWIWNDAINASMTVVVILGCFVLYVAIRGQYVSESKDRAVGLQPQDDHEMTLQKYQVPRRFSLRNIIVLTLIFAVMNVILRALAAPPIVTAVIMLFVAVVSMMQAVLERVPRLASALVGVLFGCCLVPSSTRIVDFAESILRINQMEWHWQLLLGGIAGGMLGYLSGALAAGVFLIGDSFAHWWTPDRSLNHQSRI